MNDFDKGYREAIVNMMSFIENEVPKTVAEVNQHLGSEAINSLLAESYPHE